jgi:hypothetical protein
MASLIARQVVVLAGLAVSATQSEEAPFVPFGGPSPALTAQADIPSLRVPNFPSSAAQPAPNGCADRSQVTETFGIVTLKLSNACRRLTTVHIRADDVKLAATFNGDGLAEVRIPLFHEHTDIVWEREDGSLKVEPVAFTGFRDAVRVGLVWRAHVALALHVVEPGAALASPEGHMRIEEKAATGASELGGAGFSLVDVDPFGNMEVYALPARGNPGKGLLNYYVEFVSRGGEPAGYFCGEGALASPEFEIWVLRYGDLQKFQHGVAAAPCNRPLSDKVRIQRLGDVSLSRN